MASTAAPHPGPDFTVRKDPAWYDTGIEGWLGDWGKQHHVFTHVVDGFAHPELKNAFDGLDKHNPNLVWAPFIPGITAVWLYRPEHSSTGKASSALLKVRRSGDRGVLFFFPSAHRRASDASLQFSPGASVGNHWHRGWEHVICLEGSFQDERGTFGRGSVMYNPPGSHHRGLHR